jgi:hypothetical protein
MDHVLGHGPEKYGPHALFTVLFVLLEHGYFFFYETLLFFCEKKSKRKKPDIYQPGFLLLSFSRKKR